MDIFRFVPNNIPAVLVYSVAGEECGQYQWHAYPVAAWAGNGVPLVIVPGHSRLVPGDDAIVLKGECLGVQLVPSWDTDVSRIKVWGPPGTQTPNPF